MIAFSRFARYFTEVSKLGSIRKASETLHVSASAIDRQLLQAEEDIGVPLFERIPGGLRLTAAGEILDNLIRTWQKEYLRALGQIDELQGLRRGHVEVAIIDALAEGLVPEAIGAILQEHPAITVGVQVLDNDDVAKRVASGEVDFGLLLGPFTTSGIQVQAAIDVPIGVVVPPGHPLCGNDHLRLSQTLEYRTIFPGAPLVIHERAKAVYQRAGIDVERFMACNNTLMMRSLIRQGVGLGVLSWLDVAADTAQGKLAFVPLNEPHLKSLKLVLAVAPRRQPSRAAREAMKHFESTLLQITHCRAPTRAHPT